ncbi:MAG: fumarate hydratase [Planctomycetes bacterium]|nr:fumarate hydratase [Planctomycetota bacterium]MBU1517728.1 fumarate hydratase [Planctomycetota bacterium]MBU2458073.1 fumarate hydratase [Planctomycetota bacterium]
MRTIPFEKIVSEVEKLCITAAAVLPQDVAAALEQAAKKESSNSAKKILNQLIENAKIAKEKQIPICQDTGLAVVFLQIGSQTAIKPAGKTIVDAINAGIARGYEKGFLRKSVVAQPLNNRKNTGTNTPAIIHTEIIGGDKIKITLLAKGGGCENKSQFKMFLPTDSAEKISDWIVKTVSDAGADACPPFVIGVGLGGDFEQCCLLSKKALTRKLDSQNADPFYAQMEKQLLQKINSLGIGPSGLGGDTTALAVSIETAPCHIASLPAAVNIECHAHRHSSIEI